MIGRWYKSLSLLLVMAGLVACAAPARDITSPRVEKQVVSSPAEEGARSLPVVEEPVAVSPSLPEGTRRIIYTASLVLVVEDPETTAPMIAQLAAQLDGYIVSSNLYRVNGRLRGTLSLRVPQDRFEEALTRLRALAVRVDQETRQTQDVTTEYVDLQARLTNLEATEEELRALLTEVRKRSQRASDVLEVYRELTRVREEIERLKGRIQMLDRLTSYATIEVTLVPYELREPIAERWDPRVTLYRAWGTLVRGVQLVVDGLIYALVVGAPVLVVLTVPVGGLYFIGRWVWRRIRRPKATDTEDRDPTGR